MLNKDSYC